VLTEYRVIQKFCTIHCHEQTAGNQLTQAYWKNGR